jgi:hypothetical protein
MGSKVLTLVMGFGLIIWASIPLDGKPVNINYQIAGSSIGIVMCVAAFLMIVQDNITKHIDEKLNK